jgi:hypothetical protein
MSKLWQAVEVFVDRGVPYVGKKALAAGTKEKPTIIARCPWGVTLELRKTAKVGLHIVVFDTKARDEECRKPNPNTGIGFLRARSLATDGTYFFQANRFGFIPKNDQHPVRRVLQDFGLHPGLHKELNPRFTTEMVAFHDTTDPRPIHREYISDGKMAGTPSAPDERGIRKATLAGFSYVVKYSRNGDNVAIDEIVTAPKALEPDALGNLTTTLAGLAERVPTRLVDPAVVLEELSMALNGNR